MVDMPNMHDGVVKIRRGKRTDLPEILALLTPTDSVAFDKAQARHWRRLAGDPSLDFYVAEQNGALRGALLVCYVRMLRAHGWRAVLDLVFRPPPPEAVGRDLINFAKARARKRGCRHLIAWSHEAADNGHLATLTQGGFLAVGEVLSCEL